ncbi:MAG: hypothetical protein FJ284_11810 [Planctomycetes bacterium]|nr:hypothetical protein [Planctomycetota bacterium]
MERFGRDRRAMFHAVLEEMDRQLDRLFRHVRETPALRNHTRILVKSDNGPQPGVGSAGPFRGAKTTLYEGGIRSPLIAWGPGVIAAAAAGRGMASRPAGRSRSGTRQRRCGCAAAVAAGGPVVEAGPRRHAWATCCGSPRRLPACRPPSWESPSRSETWPWRCGSRLSRRPPRFAACGPSPRRS